MGENKGGSRESKQTEWGEAIQTLVSEGHRLGDIKEYTLNQVAKFYEAIQDKKIEETKQRLYINALASSGDSKSIKKALDQLDGKPPEMMRIEHYE